MIGCPSQEQVIKRLELPPGVLSLAPSFSWIDHSGLTGIITLLKGAHYDMREKKAAHFIWIRVSLQKTDLFLQRSTPSLGTTATRRPVITMCHYLTTMRQNGGVLRTLTWDSRRPSASLQPSILSFLNSWLTSASCPQTTCQLAKKFTFLKHGFNHSGTPALKH